MRNGSISQMSPGMTRSAQQLRHRDTRIHETYQSSPKRETIKMRAEEKPQVAYNEDVTVINPSPLRGSVARVGSGLA